MIIVSVGAFAFNQEKTLVEASSVIVKTNRSFAALVTSNLLCSRMINSESRQCWAGHWECPGCGLLTGGHTTPPPSNEPHCSSSTLQGHAASCSAQLYLVGTFRQWTLSEILVASRSFYFSPQSTAFIASLQSWIVYEGQKPPVEITMVHVCVWCLVLNIKSLHGSFFTVRSCVLKSCPTFPSVTYLFSVHAGLIHTHATGQPRADPHM